jgi:hypothetical protein
MESMLQLTLNPSTSFKHFLFSLCSFALKQKNQKFKTQQSSNRTWPDAGPLLRQPTAPSLIKFF